MSKKILRINRIAPHEADDLDVVLLGHSLGGIVAADVALQQVNGQFKHRILGLINYDVPFLGLHPRVIPTGIGSSMPKKDATVEEELVGEQESMGLEPAFKPAPSPNFDPPFKNDVRLANHGFMKGVMNFVSKNKDNLPRSVFDRFASTFKFAGCVNNYSELRRRYQRLKELEAAEGSPNRVRFVNYYTASTGRKSHKAKPKPDNEGDETPGTEDAVSTPKEQEADPNQLDSNKEGKDEKESSTLEKDEESRKDESPDRADTQSPQEPKKDEPTDQQKPNTTETEESPKRTNSDNVSIQVESPAVESLANDTSSLNLTSTASSISTDRKNSLALSENASISTSNSNTGGDKAEPKIRKFILLPSHHWKSDDNSYWTPLVMKDIDEVEAHQTIFNSDGGHYEYLVGDTVALIEHWVQDDMTRRLLEENVD